MMDKAEVIVTLEDLVIEIQRRRAAGDSVEALETILLQRVAPVLRTVARRFRADVRGALAIDDLTQVGAIEALKLSKAYDASRGGPGMFTALLFREVRSKCYEVVRLHSQVFRPSLHLQQAGAKRLSPYRPSGDAPGASLPESILSVWEINKGGTAMESPEESTIRAHAAERLRRCMAMLPRALSNLLARFHGLNGPATSILQLVKELGMPKGQLTKMLRRAHMRLRRLFEGNAGLVAVSR
jgi:DNA-directed RNA polymerase specialized sigma24 family protein